MINVPLFKFLLAALSVLSCVGAVAPSTTLDVAVDTAKVDPEMRVRRALGTAPAPSPKECTALNDRKKCTRKDPNKVNKACSGGKQKKCTKLCKKKNKKLSAKCKEATTRKPSTCGCPLRVRSGLLPREDHASNLVGPVRGRIGLLGRRRPLAGR
jgi:hypothetical protein